MPQGFLMTMLTSPVWARSIMQEPGFGLRQPFLPGSCMMDRAHTGLVNMVIRKPWGIHVRVEDIVIM